MQRAKPWAPSPPHLTGPVTQTGASLLHLVSKPSNSTAAILPGSQSPESGTEQAAQAWLSVCVLGDAGSQPLGTARGRWLGGPSSLKALDSGLGVFLVSPDQAEVRLLWLGKCPDPLQDRPGDPAQRLSCSGVGSPGSTILGEGHWSEIAEPGQWGPQDHLLQVQRGRALSSAFTKRPWNFCSGPGGREASPSPQGRRLAPRSLRPHLEHAQVASGCVGRGSAGNGGTAERQWGGAGGGWGSGRTPRLGRTCLSSAGEEQVPASVSHEAPAPTPRGLFALALPGHGFCDHCCQSGSAPVRPGTVWPPSALPHLSLLCSLCQSP